MRDDFSAKVIDLLAKRVSCNCSNPTCGKPTSGPHTDPSKTINIGVAAHITAASKGGPRYDPLLTPQERASSSNGIWLCQVCAHLIDTDVTRYRTDLLNEWKNAAEKNALAEIEGKDLSELLRRKRPSKWPTYSIPEIFVQRQVVYSSGLSKSNEENIKPCATLTELISEGSIIKPCRIVLQSEAGAGKTTELEFVAHYFSVDPDKLLFPILITLKNYTNQDITVLLDHYCKNWKGLEESELLLILDGLDEVKAEEREDFIRKIRTFTDIYSNCNILLSCRANFSNSVSQLQSFRTYTLYEFRDQDIQAYAGKRLPTTVDQFMTFITERELIQWLRNPFSLTHFVTFYENDPASVPQSRIDLLHRIVALPHLNHDLHRLQADEEQVFYRRLLMKLAFAMNLLGVNVLSETQKVELFPDLTDRNKLKEISFLKVNEDQILFKHNILQEYFAASVLAATTFEQIRVCVTFQPNHEKLKPKWLNTLGILLEMLLPQSTILSNVLSLISEQEPQLLLTVEYGHFSQSLRLQAFQTILHQPNRRYSRNLMYDSRLADLANISGNPDIIDHLLETIPSEDVWLKAESLYYLQHADPKYLFGYEQQIKDTLKQVLLQKDNGIHHQKLAIEVLTSLSLHEPEFDQLLTRSLPNIDNAELRDEVYLYLNQSAKVDDYIDFYIAGFDTYKDYRKKETARLAGLGRGFREGLELIETPSGLHKLLDYLIANVSFVRDHSDVFDKWRSNNNSSFSIFAFRLAKAYEKDNSLYDKVLNLYKSLSEHFRRPHAQELASFFRLTHTDRLTFYNIIEDEEDKHWSWSLGWIASEEIVLGYLLELKTENINSKQIWRIINSLYNANQSELAEQFRERINIISGNKFERDTSWATKEQLRQQNDQALLLDQQTFIQKVNDIFDYYQNNALDQQQVWGYKNDLEDTDNEVTVHYLNLWLNDSNRQKVNRDQAVNYLYNIENWDDYTVGESLNLVESNQQISQNHIDKIVDWSYAKFPEADFSNAISEFPNGSWSYRPLERRLAKVYLLFHFSLSDDILLNMLSFDDNGLATARSSKEKEQLTLSEKIIQEVDSVKIKERVLSNLKSGINVKLVLSNHIALCGKLEIQESTPILKSVLEGDYLNSLSDYELPRVLEIYLDLGGKLNELIFIFNKFDVNNEFHWTLLGQFAEAGIFHNRINKLLLRKAEEGTIEKTSLKLMRQLINVGNTEGLLLFANCIKLNNKLPGEYNQLGNVKLLPAQEAAELLLDLLLYSINNDVQGDRFHEAIEIIMMYLKDVSLVKDSTYEYVIGNLTDIAATYTSHPKHYFLKSSLLFLEKEYYLQKTDYQTIADIRPVLAEYFS